MARQGTKGITLQDILQFAIEKEQESVDFYANLAKKTENLSLREEIDKIRQMEETHRDRLQTIQPESLLSLSSGKIKDMKIADYTVKTQPKDEMTWQDLINIAMHRELAAMQLYDTLVRNISDPVISKIFAVLAAEESGHKSFFEKLWDEEVLKEN